MTDPRHREADQLLRAKAAELDELQVKSDATLKRVDAVVSESERLARAVNQTGRALRRTHRRAATG